MPKKKKEIINDVEEESNSEDILEIKMEIESSDIIEIEDDDLEFNIKDEFIVEEDIIEAVEEDIILSKHAIEGKHSLKYDSIFKNMIVPTEIRCIGRKQFIYRANRMGFSIFTGTLPQAKNNQPTYYANPETGHFIPAFLYDHNRLKRQSYRNQY